MNSICEKLGHSGKVKRLKGLDKFSMVCDCHGKKSNLWKLGVDVEIKGNNICGCGKPFQPKPYTYRVIDCKICNQTILL